MRLVRTVGPVRMGQGVGHTKSSAALPVRAEFPGDDDMEPLRAD